MASEVELHPSHGQDPRWRTCDLSLIFNREELQKLVEDIVNREEAEFTEDTTAPPLYEFPDFGANKLQPTALKHLCSELSNHLQKAVAPVSDIPSLMVLSRMMLVWQRVLSACSHERYTNLNIKRVLATLKKEQENESKVEEGKKDKKTMVSPEKLTGNEMLVEMGVRTGLSVVFSLLKQAWMQILWQKQLENHLQQQQLTTGVPVPFISGATPGISLPNEVLRSVLDIFKGLPPLSLSNMKSLSQLSLQCLKQSTEFLEWVLQPESLVDNEGKRLASEIMISLSLQQGSLTGLVEWVVKMLECLGKYHGDEEKDEVVMCGPCLSVEFCESVMKEIRKRTHIASSGDESDQLSFQPKKLTPEGHAPLLDFILYLSQELSTISQRCTAYFSESSSSTSSTSKGRFLSEASEVYAFGSNSSSQLAMGSTEKFHKASLMQHMADVQVIEAGQYCSFLIFGDGSMKACGKGSYGRLGLGNSDSQSALKPLTTFPSGVSIRRMASSRGSDGHSLAITSEGEVYSWGDGNYGKLGHGDNVTSKLPKLIAGLSGKVIRHVACGNRHSAAVTVDGELYTWGEGDHGRLGHGNTTSHKTPTKVDKIELVQQVSCGVAHTLALAMDGLTVWSFGSGDSGKLGHGDTGRVTTPKAIEALRGMMCQKVCAASQFSLVLTAGGKVYSFGNGSGVGKGSTEPRQVTPWLIESLDNEMVIDISTGDGHCLALTQRGEVYGWGTNSMGQCGQGHSNGSITAPSKVQGLDGIQIQQISAGTSHSIVWTAVPMDRRASAMWQWPYCVSVCEKTFESLVDLLNKFGSIDSDIPPKPPFTNKETQESFLLSLLSLTRTHLSLVAPLGPTCVHMACGSQVKPLRNLLFKLVDSKLPPSLDQVTSDALEVGSSVLLPPVVDRLELLLSILPEDPSILSKLTTGQRRQLDILLGGFSDRSSLVGILVNDELLDSEDDFWVGSSHAHKLFTLTERMALYIYQATLASLRGDSLPEGTMVLGSPLLKTFEEFILSVYINVLNVLEYYFSGMEPTDYLTLVDEEKECIRIHFSTFHWILKEYSMTLLSTVTELAQQAEQPESFFLEKQDALFGFLAYQFPYHISLTATDIIALDSIFNHGAFLLKMAQTVHGLVKMLPEGVVMEMEKDELLWEPMNIKPAKIKLTRLHGAQPDSSPWRKLIYFERSLCLCTAIITRRTYVSSPVSSLERENSVLEYSPSGGKTKKPSLVSSHLLSNGAVGNEQEMEEAIYTWVSLCKTLPSDHPDSEKDKETDQDVCEIDDPNLKQWSNHKSDYKFLSESDNRLHKQLILGKKLPEIKKCVAEEAIPLLALAMGASGNSTAENIYHNMLEFARHRDWNTWSDEEALPQLKQVSCTALACLLKHSGLLVYATSNSTKPKKKLVDVYRTVFSLRREIFTNRPIPNSEGNTSPGDKTKFELQCNGICATLMFLMCVLDPALPEETEPIVPQITTGGTPNNTSISADDVGLRSPGSSAHHSGGTGSLKGPPQRLFSHPEIRDDTSPSTVSPKDTPIATMIHSTSLDPQLHQEEGWSLASVKQALSHLRWQRDRLDLLHTTVLSGGGNHQESPHLQICAMIVDIVSLVFSMKVEENGDDYVLPDSEAKLMNRVCLVRALMSQQRRAMYRAKALQRILEFLSDTEDTLLSSSRLIYLSCCLNHKTHYSDDIVAAPSVLQHEVKSLSHSLLQQVINRVYTLDVAKLNDFTSLGLQRELLLAIQWINFDHHPSDLQLLFTGDLYNTLTTLSGVVSSCVSKDMPSPSSRLANRLRLSCVLVRQLLAVRVGMNAEVLKTWPDILSIVSSHLYGQLEGFVATDNTSIMQRWEARECTVEEREGLLGDFLRFVNTLSATHDVIRSVLASETWFATLLRIVDIDTSTGVPVVSSLKTRLLALQVLGAIMAELSDTTPDTQAKCTKIVEDLLELMYRCMFLAPVSQLQAGIKPPDRSLPTDSTQATPLPLAIEPSYGDTMVTREGGEAIIEGVGDDDHVLLKTPLTTGVYTWKVTVTSDSENMAVFVGVTQNPPLELPGDGSWLLGLESGQLYHGVEDEPTEFWMDVARGDSVTVEYNTLMKTLSFCKNDGELRKAFDEVEIEGKELYPIVQFHPRPSTVRLFPIIHTSHTPLAQIQHSEKAISGYPILSPTSTTLVQSVVSILYQLQHKEPWSRAITQVISSKFSEMDALIHRLLDIEAEISASKESMITSISLLMTQLTQVVWPSLAVVGGVDAGFCLGRSCMINTNGEPVAATLAGMVPDSETRVEVQELVTTDTAKVKKRKASLSKLQLVSQTQFSLPLISERLTPSSLFNLAHLAGYLDYQHSLPHILEQAHLSNKPHHSKDISKCYPYHQLCSSLLQMAASKSLHTILFDESAIRLLTYQPPSIEVVVAGDYQDKSELAGAVRDILKCLASRAVKPSPLRPTLRMMELEKIHAVLAYECLNSVAEYALQSGHRSASPPVKEKPSGFTEVIDHPLALEETGEISPPPIPEDPSESSLPEEGGGEGEESARPSTPPMVPMLMDMGFSRAQVNVALERCEVPPGTREEARMQLIVSWIIDHPNAVSEEEARLEQSRGDLEAEEDRRRREQQQQQQEEADQSAAADEFLSIVGEMFDSCATPTGSENGEERKKDTKHASDLLEGPDIDEDVPDISLTGLDSSPQSHKSLLSALGLSQKRPTPRKYEFSSSDPMGENLCKMTRDGGEPGEDGVKSEGSGSQSTTKDATSTDLVKLSTACNELLQQAQKLKSLDERLSAINRIASATQTLVARHITMLAIASLSVQPPSAFIQSLQALDLVNVQSLVRLLRLVHAGRIDGTQGSAYSLKTPSSLLPIKGLQCLSSAISTVITENGTSAGSQLMQSCSRDLLAAAVGGAALLRSSSRRRRHRRDRTEKDKAVKSDVSILSNPNFSVSQSLVQTLAESTGKIVYSESSAGIVQMIDALAACLFSSKLQPEHRFWALEQLLKVFASSGTSGSKKELALKSQKPQDLVSASSLEHLTGHKGQIMACSENSREKKIVSIGEDNSVILWDLQAGLARPETQTLPFPTSSPPSPSSPPPDPSSSPSSAQEGLLLPILAQSYNHICVAGAVNETLCVWRVRDKKTVTHTFPELITTLQWKPTQKDGEAPLLLVGLVDGGVVLVEVLRASVNLSPEIQTTRIEQWTKGAVCCISWSPDGSKFAISSTAGCVQIFSGAGREYSPSSEMKNIQVTSLSWSPDSVLLTTLQDDATLKLWSVSGDVPIIRHSFDAYPTTTMMWHSQVSETGNMLLASGGKDGSVHLWTVQQKQAPETDQADVVILTDQSDELVVSHVTSLEGHPAPITSLVFCESDSLLASGCKAGSVRVWDLMSCSLLKYATRSVGEVVNMSWTTHGLAVCYKNTTSLCLLPPGPEYYLGERCIHTCLPMLNQYSISEPDKAPCLMALLKNLYHVLLDQYQYEQAEISSSHQLVHSEYLQLLTSLAVGLGLYSVLVSPPHPPHITPPPPTKEWVWLADFTRSVRVAESLTKRSTLPEDVGFKLPSDILPTEKYQPTDNSIWSVSMDQQILEWMSQRPQDWWHRTMSAIYTWGKGSWNQLGHSTRENAQPTIVEDWKDVQQIVAGSYCTYAVKFDGTVMSVGEGSYGRLGHGGSENETNMRVVSGLQGIPVIQMVGGPRVSTSTDEGFALAVTDSGDVYSWGKGYKGRLGHTTSENTRTPKMVEALGGKDVKMVASCDYHCAAVTTGGCLYTFGSKENGKLGHGRDAPSGSVGHVTQVVKFMDSDEQTELVDIKIGYVSCGQMFTLALSEDGRQVFGTGKSDNCAFGTRDITGDHYHFMLLNHLAAFGPFVKSASGNRYSALINTEGKVCVFGKLYDSLGQGVDAQFIAFPDDEKITDIATAAQYMIALSENGNVYYWGKNQYGVTSSATQATPKLMDSLSGKNLQQISAAVRHGAASDSPRPVKGISNLTVPTSVPVQYSALREVSCTSIHARLLLLNHFSKIIMTSWRLFSTRCEPKGDMTRFHINPLSDSCTRSLLSPLSIEGMVAGVMSRTMVSKQHGPSVNVQRISQDDRTSKVVYPQIASQILQKDSKELRCHSRAWKVNLMGEGADDAGGVFDETIAQMCEELEKGVVKLLIQTPNARNKCGFNTDRYVFDPSCTSPRDIKHLKFLGLLFGVAMRTKKPLDLHLAQPMWKLLAGITLTTEDLEEIDLMFVQTMNSIRDIHKSGIREEEFSEMIPIELFEAQSISGKFVPIVPGGSGMKLTYQNRKDYVEKAVQFRLHELDVQVSAVREGMSTIVPVPLLSLYTAKMLESAVCGSEEVDLQMLKKVVRYRDGTSEGDSVIQWLWSTLESFTNEERILFLRFVSGRSRLPVRVSEIPQRFQISVCSQSNDSLPTAQTCFFQLRVPSYSSQEILAERLRYAIRNCRSIDMDNYMLRRSGSDYYDDSDYGDIYDSD